MEFVTESFAAVPSWKYTAPETGVSRRTIGVRRKQTLALLVSLKQYGPAERE